MNGAGLPPGMDLSPEAMRGMVDTMTKMDPSQLDSMMASMDAARAPPAPGSSTAAAAPSPSSMPTDAADPQQFQQAAAALQVPIHTLIPYDSVPDGMVVYTADG
jgi:hypothetical protein